MSYEFHFYVIRDNWEFLIEGVWLTLGVTGGALASSMVLGLVFGVLRLADAPWLKYPAMAYIETFRNTPALVQLIWVYYCLPILTGLDLNAAVSGGVGSALLQLVPARGARAVAVTSRAKLDQVRTLEPFAAVARDEGDLVDSARAVLGCDGVEVVADVVGGPQFGAVLALLAGGGRYVTSGAIAGPVVALDLRTVYLKRLRMIGVSLGMAHHFETVLDHIRAGRIKPLLAGTYPLADLKQAQTDFLGKRFFGNLVVLPRET